jgi:DNA polymerase-1
VDPNNQRPVLICDAMNLFLRSFCAYPTMSTHGYQMGGCIGFMKTLQRIVNEQQPTAIYVCWEGGGSQRRRSLYSDYKMNRKPEKLNRFYEDDLPDTKENEKHQLLTLLAMLKHVPVCQIYVSDCEGDDVIAHLCNGPFRNQQKIIASSDKDFYQLLNSETKIYSLHKKKYVSEPDVLVEFRVRAQNFALAKALCGDKSDNVPGIKGLGFKTIAKMYPFLGTENDIILQDVIDYAAAHIDDSIVHRRVFEQQDDVRRNWKLVYLDGGMLSANQSSSVDHLVSTFKPKADKMGLVRHLVKEGIGDFDVEGFYYVFNSIDGIEYKMGEKS